MAEVKFSIPAYIAAAIAGSVAMALFVAVGGGLNVAGPGLVLILLFAAFSWPPQRPVRLLGVTLSGFEADGAPVVDQLSLVLSTP